MQLILNAKCHAIRDAQLIEKVEIKKEQLEEEKRLDEMMEVERLKALNEYEEREKAAHFDRLKGAKVIQLQITDNEQSRLLDEERKDQETKVFIHSYIQKGSWSLSSTPWIKSSELSVKCGPQRLQASGKIQTTD